MTKDGRDAVREQLSERRKRLEADMADLERQEQMVLAVEKFEALGVPNSDAQHLAQLSSKTRTRVLLDGKSI